MKLYKKIKYVLSLLGFNPTVMINFFRGIPLYLHDLWVIKKQLRKAENKDFNKISFVPMMGCRYNTNGNMKGHYFHQDLLVAKKIYANNPKKHVDIGSRVDGFVAQIAVFREIEVFDVRPQISNTKNIEFKQADFMKLPESLINYCDSVSSLHAIEHFGLGRYGDPVDSEGHVKGINSIHKMLKQGGKFYFSVPIGPQRIEFHAHRVFDISYLLRLLEPLFFVNSFSYVDDSGNLNENINLEESQIKKNYGCYYGCGIFELTKK